MSVPNLYISPQFYSICDVGDLHFVDIVCKYKITNMATVRSFEFISDRLKVGRICVYVSSSQK
jgi:hypothetical protein